MIVPCLFVFFALSVYTALALDVNRPFPGIWFSYLYYLHSSIFFPSALPILACMYEMISMLLVCSIHHAFHQGRLLSLSLLLDLFNYFPRFHNPRKGRHSRHVMACPASKQASKQPILTTKPPTYLPAEPT